MTPTTEREQAFYQMGYQCWLMAKGYKALFIVSLIGNIVQWLSTYLH